MAQLPLSPGFFKAIDKDGSGSLDPAEIQRGFRRLGVDVSLISIWKALISTDPVPFGKLTWK